MHTQSQNEMKRYQNVIMLSSMRPYNKIKATIFKFYDFTKGGIDIVDQKAFHYKSKSRKWKLVGFYYLVETACINATTMWALENVNDSKKLKSFELDKSLVMLNIRRRPLTGLSKNIKMKISLVLGDWQATQALMMHIFYRRKVIKIETVGMSRQHPG